MEDTGKNAICLQPTIEHLKVLRENFSHSRFKSEQWEVIRAIIYEKRDCFIIAGTGFGKSLIYQFPPIFLRKIAIIISPLISLMQDQVLALQRKQINACLLGSVQKNTNIDLTRYRVIYLTPEYLDGKTGQEKLKTIQSKICVVAIDECHCITQWRGFRPKYRKLAGIRSMFPNVPIVCLTATATKHCIEDVCKSLQLKNPLIARAELNRPNLKLFVFKQSENFVNDVKKYVERVEAGAVIIYVLRRRDAVEHSEALNRVGFDSRPYHAGMKDKERSEVLKEFSHGKLRLVVATIAFGMGIDRADVRLVIHYGTPKNVESYLQESGRAGRDGAPSNCIIFWREQDFNFHSYWLNLNVSKTSNGYKGHCKRLLGEMREYLETENCRRMKILQYFDSSIPNLPIHELCCDNCIEILHKTVPLHQMYKNVDKKNKIDISVDARLLLRLVKAYQGNGSLLILKCFIGEAPTTFNKNLPLELFSKGKSKEEAWWIKILEVLCSNNMIQTRHVSIDSANDLKVTNKGMKFVRRNSTKFKLSVKRNLLEFLDKTNIEFYIEGKELKNKPRHRIPKIVKVEKETLNEKLFNFEVPKFVNKQFEDLSEDDDIPSTSNPSIKDEEEEDDFFLQNTKLNFEMSRRPLKLDLDELLNLIDESFTREVEDGASMENKCGERSQQAVLDIDTSSVDVIASCSLKISLKRRSHEENEEEFPVKLARLSQET